MYLLAPFILQNFKKILRADPELWGCAIFGPKMAHFSWKIFFWYKPLLLLSSTYWHFSLCKILKKLFQWIQSYEDALFLGPKWSICPQFFFLKIINISLIYLLALFIVQNFKKNSSCRYRVMRVCNFWAQNGPYPEMRNFSENMLLSLVSFTHAYLHAKNQSQILIY